MYHSDLIEVKQNQAYDRSILKEKGKTGSKNLMFSWHDEWENKFITQIAVIQNFKHTNKMLSGGQLPTIVTIINSSQIKYYCKNVMSL